MIYLIKTALNAYYWYDSIIWYLGLGNWFMTPNVQVAFTYGLSALTYFALWLCAGPVISRFKTITPRVKKVVTIMDKLLLGAIVYYIAGIGVSLKYEAFPEGSVERERRPIVNHFVLPRHNKTSQKGMAVIEKIKGQIKAQGGEVKPLEDLIIKLTDEYKLFKAYKLTDYAFSKIDEIYIEFAEEDKNGKLTRDKIVVENAASDEEADFFVEQEVLVDKKVPATRQKQTSNNPSSHPNHVPEVHIVINNTQEKDSKQPMELVVSIAKIVIPILLIVIAAVALYFFKWKTKSIENEKDGLIDPFSNDNEVNNDSDNNANDNGSGARQKGPGANSGANNDKQAPPEADQGNESASDGDGDHGANNSSIPTEIPVPNEPEAPNGGAGSFTVAKTENNPKYVRERHEVQTDALLIKLKRGPEEAADTDTQRQILGDWHDEGAKFICHPDGQIHFGETVIKPYEFSRAERFAIVLLNWHTQKGVPKEFCFNLETAKFANSALGKPRNNALTSITLFRLRKSGWWQGGQSACIYAQVARYYGALSCSDVMKLLRKHRHNDLAIKLLEMRSCERDYSKGNKYQVSKKKVRKELLATIEPVYATNDKVEIKRAPREIATHGYDAQAKQLQACIDETYNYADELMRFLEEAEKAQREAEQAVEAKVCKDVEGLIRSYGAPCKLDEPYIDDEGNEHADPKKEWLYAAVYGNQERLEELYKFYGSNIIHATDEDGYTALHFSAHEGHLPCVTYLLEKGAELEAQNSYKRTALGHSAMKGHLDCVKYFLEKGADIHDKNEYGDTAFHISAFNGHLEVGKYLVEKGADIHAKNKDGETALHLSAHEGHLNIVRYLVENQADIHTKNNYGHTALQWAQKRERTDVANYLKQKAGQGWMNYFNPFGKATAGNGKNKRQGGGTAGKGSKNSHKRTTTNKPQQATKAPAQVSKPSKPTLTTEQQAQIAEFDKETATMLGVSVSEARDRRLQGSVFKDIRQKCQQLRNNDDPNRVGTANPNGVKGRVIEKTQVKTWVPEINTKKVKEAARATIKYTKYAMIAYTTYKALGKVYSAEGWINKMEAMEGALLVAERGIGESGPSVDKMIDREKEARQLEEKVQKKVQELEESVVRLEKQLVAKKNATKKTRVKSSSQVKGKRKIGVAEGLAAAGPATYITALATGAATAAVSTVLLPVAPFIAAAGVSMAMQNAKTNIDAYEQEMNGV